MPMVRVNEWLTVNPLSVASMQITSSLSHDGSETDALLVITMVDGRQYHIWQPREVPDVHKVRQAIEDSWPSRRRAKNEGSRLRALKAPGQIEEGIK